MHAMATLFRPPRGQLRCSIDTTNTENLRLALSGYRRFALSAPSERSALTLFFRYVPVVTPEEVQGLDEPPALIIYQ